MRLGLVVLRGPREGERLDFFADHLGREIVLGRSAAADIAITDILISRRHCRVTFGSRGAELEDLGSQNGTFLNGNPVQRSPLKGGDVIKIGSTELLVRLESDFEALAELVEGATVPGAGLCHGCQRVITANEARLGRSTLCSLCYGHRISIPGIHLGRCLGEGGFGSVFEATRQNGEIIAVKILHGQGSEPDEGDLRRFHREAALAAKLVHPNIVRVIDRGEVGSERYIIMERIQGGTLYDIVKQSGPFEAPRALAVIRQIGAALEFARSLDVVHRDVKPENIILQDDGVAKIIDFGLAKRIFGTRTGTTLEGEGLGSVPYLPPEQIDDALNADHRSDIYSLGATLYEMLAGVAPVFNEGDQPPSVVELLTKDPRPVEALRPEVPPFASAIVKKCMKKKPAERYQEARQLVAEIDRLLDPGIDLASTAGDDVGD